MGTALNFSSVGATVVATDSKSVGSSPSQLYGRNGSLIVKYLTVTQKSVDSIPAHYIIILGR